MEGPWREARGEGPAATSRPHDVTGQLMQSRPSTLRPGGRRRQRKAGRMVTGQQHRSRTQTVAHPGPSVMLTMRKRLTSLSIWSAKTGASKGCPLSGMRPGGRLSGACTSGRVRWRVLLFIWLRQNGPALPSQWAGFVCPARIAAALAVSSVLHAFGVSLMQLRAMRRPRIEEFSVRARQSPVKALVVRYFPPARREIGRILPGQCRCDKKATTASVIRALAVPCFDRGRS